MAEIIGRKKRCHGTGGEAAMKNAAGAAFAVKPASPREARFNKRFHQNEVRL